MKNPVFSPIAFSSPFALLVASSAIAAAPALPETTHLVLQSGSGVAAAATSEWWSNETGGWIGGGLGAAMGLAGGFIGLTGGLRIWRKALVVVLTMLFAGGVVSLLLGGTAYFAGQPYHVWYPPTLIGLLGSILPVSIWPSIRARFAEDELRRMSAMDAR